MGIGSALRKARLSRGVSIEDAARDTRIRAELLDALEQEEFDRLLGDVYVRGCLRSYATYLGLSPDRVVERYADRDEPAPPIPSAPPPLPPAEPAAGRRRRGTFVRGPGPHHGPALRRRCRRRDGERPRARDAGGDGQAVAGDLPVRIALALAIAAAVPERLTVRAEVLGIGTELLLGQIENSNARWISERLAEVGVDVLRHEVVGDNLERITEAFERALGRADVVIATGGVGPTQDDITREALAAATGVRLVRRPEIETALRARFEAMGRRMPDSNLRQADVPEGGRPIRPQLGSAPGLAVDLDGRRIYALPGVPAEMREMMEGTVLRELRELVGSSTIASRILRCVGMAESRVAELLDDLFLGSTNPTVAFLAGGGEVKVRITAKAEDHDRAGALIEPLVERALERLGDVVFSTEDEDLAHVVGRLLVERSRTIAAAESLTGGGLAGRLSFAEGASAFFLGSAVCYSAEAKISVLGVSPSTIEGPGPVSEACAREMATGARRLFSADVGISTTGVAGPEAHGGEPPGTVWVGLDADGVSFARRLFAPGGRELVRARSTMAALDLVRRQLLGLPLPA